MKISILLLALTLCLSACSMKDYESIPGTVDTNNLDGVTEIEINDMSEHSIGMYSDVFSDVRYVALELTKESIVGDIDKIAVTPNNELLVLDSNNKSILLFDSIGKFKNRIGSFGHGKNEYISPLDIAYDKYHDNVIVYDIRKNKLMYYDIAGNYKKSVSLKKQIYNFEVLDDSHLVLFSNYLQEVNEKINYNYTIIDTLGNIVKEYAPFDKSMNGLVMSMYPFHKYNDKNYSHIDCTPIVNEISLHKMQPSYLINFGDYQNPNSYYLGGYDTFRNKILSLEPHKAVSERFYQTDDYILMTFRRKDKGPNMSIEFMIMPHKHASEQKIYYSLFNDMYGKRNYSSLFKILDVSNDKVYFLCNFDDPIKFACNTDISTDVAKLYRKIAKSESMEDEIRKVHYKFVSELESHKRKIYYTKEDDILIDSLSNFKNPVIQICTLKK